MLKSDDFSVLIPDGESHILLYVVNCLAQIKGIKIFVMSNKKQIAMRYSRYVHHFSYYPKTHIETQWISNINKELEKFDIDIVMPIFEDGIKTIIKHQSLILFQNKLGLLPSLNNFNCAINKGDLSKHLEKNNIPNPKSVLIESVNQISTIENLNFPVIIKPLEGFGGGQGISVFNTKDDLENHFNLKGLNYTNIVQEYIEGYDIDCSVLCKEGNILAYTIQKGNMFDKSEFSPQVGLKFLYEKELYIIVEKLMKSLNWSGVAHVDMRYDKNDNQFKVIEVNTRFWVSLDASLIAGVNFPYIYCLTSITENFDEPTYEYIEYLNLKGIIKKTKKDWTFLFKTKFIWNSTPLKFAIKDPIPMVYKFVDRTKNIILSSLK